MEGSFLRVSEIRKVCILGAGTMGSAIALNFASNDFDVNLYDVSEEALGRGYSSIRNSLQVLVENDLVKQDEVPEIMGRIKGCMTLKDASDEAWFVIECAPEKLELKQKLFRDLEEYFPDDAIFASNTSSLSPTKIAALLSRKERFTASNFWNPAYLLPLVEIMPGEETSAETVQTVRELMEKIGKKPVVLTRETPGFLGNRLQFALLREALYLVDSGIATKEDVDAAVKYGIGRRLGDTGPLETADLGGTHVYAAICESLFGELNSSGEVSPTLANAVQQGDLGYTTGKGLYKWTEEGLARIQHNRQQTLIDWLHKDKEREE